MLNRERRCIVTGKAYDESLLIRFVLGPQGQVVPDLASKIDKQLGSINNQKKSWIEQLNWGELKHESILPAPSPLIEKLEYE